MVTSSNLKQGVSVTDGDEVGSVHSSLNNSQRVHSTKLLKINNQASVMSNNQRSFKNEADVINYSNNIVNDLNLKTFFNSSWFENQIQSCNKASEHLFFRVEEHELKSQELFDKIAKQEVQKRLLEHFYHRFNELNNISDESKKKEAIELLNKEFIDTITLSNELDNYTNCCATKEFLLKILTLEDFRQLKLASIAITGNNKDANAILSSNIGLFESYIEDRASFVASITKLYKEHKKEKKAKESVSQYLNNAV